MKDDFKASASIEILKERAKIIKSIRAFFDNRGFFEVDTPVLSHDIVVDRYLEPISVAGDQLTTRSERGRTLWLQTSPEFCMKRLVACGAEAIYQIAHAFRAGESGDFHNPEFSMLEWYRAGDDMQKGMDLLAEFAQYIFGSAQCTRTSYQAVFEKYAQIDGLSNDLRQYENSAVHHEVDASALSQSEDVDEWRNLILTHVIEPKLGESAPEIVYDWPASQSALAIVRGESPPVAERFELYYRGIELGNGYHELLDANELLLRNKSTNAQRAIDGKPQLPNHSFLIDAMKYGLPACSGVAIGIDRLVMLATKSLSISDVITFPVSNC